MNGVPWIIAASVNSGVEFGMFVNTLGWTYGTASATRQQLDLYSTKAVAVDIVVATWPSASSSIGSSRADSIQGTVALALVLFYWLWKMCGQEILVDIFFAYICTIHAIRMVCGRPWTRSSDEPSGTTRSQVFNLVSRHLPGQSSRGW
jgi:hypothetical protein